MFDYSKLLGKIKEVFKTQEAFAAAMELSLSAVNQRLNNRTDWTPAEIVKACNLLYIDISEVADYFFTLKVQKTILFIQPKSIEKQNLGG